MPENFDVIVIGAGQAGPALALRYAGAGKTVAIIERDKLGGTCLNTGCIPTKTLIASARAAHVARHAAEWGVQIAGAVSVDMKRVKARKDAVVAHFSNGLRKALENAPNITTINGHARFVGPHEVAVGERTLRAPLVFIDVGGRAAIPNLSGIESVPYLDNSRIMDLDVLPEHLIIIGGSYIGLEFAQMIRRFGARVTVVEMGPRLIGREDEDISNEIAAILTKEGVELRLNAKCVALERRGDRIGVSVDCDAGEPVLEGSHLLIATGRKPNTDDLGLAAAGIATDARGFITVDDSLATNVAGVYALGECNGRGAFTHTTWNDYEIVAANLFDGGARKVSERITVYALFTDPPLGRAGLTDAQVKASGRRALAAKIPMRSVGRAVEMGETAGFMKIAVDADSHEILGAAVLGVHGDEVVQAILQVMRARAPYTLITEGMHIHPTVTEFLPTLLQGLKPLQ